VFVRWSNLSLEAEDTARLPGYRDEAVVRHFGAPEAIQTRFYEVRAKSIINRVPDASQVPFRWTINPYRGCAHSCVYCLSGDTPVLMGDGSHRPIAELEVGDEIYGTQYTGQYRRYTKTKVLDKWITVKRAFRIALRDGTELIASGDHRFLTDRGWKHVIRSEPEEGQRPFLTTNNHLLGTGQFAPQPTANDDYRQGYLCGVVRGDGHLGSYSYERAGRAHGDVHRFRLALADLEPLIRAREFLQLSEVPTSERVFQKAAGARREIIAIGTSSGPLVERVRRIVEWPLLPTLDWCRGFLAGVFDAEGWRSACALRIANADPEILAWIEASAQRLGFDVTYDVSNDPNGVKYVRIRGGLKEHLRFFHLTDPAITRKRSIDGQMVKTFADLTIEAIEPLNVEMPLYDITTGTGDFIANGVVSHNCFARPTHKYLDFDAGRDFEREIVVKVNAPELLRIELARPSWKGEHIALGTNTDPYQWVEGRYKLMPGIWEAMRDAANPCSILTKSPLLLRDLPLMKEINERADFSAALSVPTIDERAWRATEPHTPNPRARLEALAELTRAGIRTGVLVAPLMPGINDSPEQVAKIVELATQAGASYISGIALHLRGDVKGLFFEWLEEHRPDLLPRYRELYRKGAYVPQPERHKLATMVKGPDLPVSERMRGRIRTREDDRREAEAAAARQPIRRPPRQERLF
jgi:DNA repair photolyase